MFYLKEKTKGQCVHCPSHGVGQDHAKNILKEWRSLSLGVHCLMPGTGPGNSSGGFILGKAGSTGGGESCRPQTAQATVGQGPWRTMLSTVYRKGFVHLGMPSTGAGVTWLGGMVRRRQRHHSGLWCDVFTTELNVEGGVDSRSLTARKHTLESSDGLCKPVPDQESGNSFSYLVRGVLMDCMATLG